MSFSILTIVGILLAHWISDFVLQPQWMASNKSKLGIELIVHIFVYTVTLGLMAFPALGLAIAFKWAAINGVLHLVIDAVTSQLTSYFYAKKDIHNFFVVIGFDQFLHVSLLLTTAALLF